MNEWKEFIYAGVSMLIASFIIVMVIQFNTLAKGVMNESNNFSYTQEVIKVYRDYSAFDGTDIEVVELEYIIDKTRGSKSVFVFNNKSDFDKFLSANPKKLLKSPAQLGISSSNYLMYSKYFNTPEKEYDITTVDNKLMNMCGGAEKYLMRSFTSTVTYDESGQPLYIATYLKPEGGVKP